MPKSDTWPGGVAIESLSNMDSAGSCDSVISMNSSYSEDSMEHLSAEERACLMYLEQTIEALEVQEDSGLSNDEPDSVSLPVNDIPGVQPTVSAANGKDATLTSVDLMSKSKSTASKPDTSSKNTPTQTRVLYVSTDGDGKPKIVTSPRNSPGQSIEVSELDLGLIPPPSDFMDEQGPLVQPVQVKDPRPSAGISSNKPGATIDLEQLRKRASEKRTSVSSSMTQKNPNKPKPDLSLSLSQTTMISGPQMGPAPETFEPRSPPTVAPKPKKLPANIILKSNKISVASDGNAGHLVPTSSERVLLDPQRVHFEALRKLGLLKSDESVTGPALSPKDSPKTRRSWPAPSSPVSPAALHTPPLIPSSTCVNSSSPASVTPLSPSALSPLVNSTAPAVQYSPDILPAPAAFSDPIGPLLPDNKPSVVKDNSEAKVNAQVNTLSFTPPALTKQLTPPKFTNVKSATLERSGLGLSSYMADHNYSETCRGVSSEESPSQLRNSRPRPASLGSRKEFSSAQGELLQAGHATSKDLLPANTSHQHSGDSQKLPRSQGISVLICPRAENGEDRRKALKKLGLLRD